MDDENQSNTGRRRFVQAALTASALGAANLYAQNGQAAQARTEVTRVARSATMPRRKLGATGATVPVLHLGTSQRLDPSLR